MSQLRHPSEIKDIKLDCWNDLPPDQQARVETLAASVQALGNGLSTFSLIAVSMNFTKGQALARLKCFDRDQVQALRSDYRFRSEQEARDLGVAISRTGGWQQSSFYHPKNLLIALVWASEKHQEDIRYKRYRAGTVFRLGRRSAG